MSRKALDPSRNERSKINPLAFLALQAQLIAGRVFARSAKLKEAVKTAAKAIEPVAPYKLEQRRRRERCRRVILHKPMPAGMRYWTTDGQGYEWQEDGSVRKITDPAPAGYLTRARAAWHQ